MAKSSQTRNPGQGTGIIQNYKHVDLYPFVSTWMEKNGYTKEQIKQVKALPGHALSITASISARMLLKGMPDYNKKEDDYWQLLLAQWARWLHYSPF